MPRCLPSAFDELALALEIDLVIMRDKKGFRRRLKRALNEAYTRGAVANKALSHR